MTTAPEPAEQAKPRPRNDVSKTPDLDKVREILFGEHLQGLEGALQRTESRILDHVEKLRGEMNQRCDELEARIASTGDAGASAVSELRDENEKRCAALAEELGAELAKLQRSTMDRKRLSSMLGNLANLVVDDSDSE